MKSVREEMVGPPWHWVPPGAVDPVAAHRGSRSLSVVGKKKQPGAKK